MKLLLVPRNATNRLDKLVKELDKEVNMDSRISACVLTKFGIIKEAELRKFVFIPALLDEQSAESGSLIEAAGARASSVAAAECREPPQGGNGGGQEAHPGKPE